MSDYARGPVKHLGKRGRYVESIFAELPKEHRTEAVFLALCRAANVTEQRARSHWGLGLALLAGKD